MKPTDKTLLEQMKIHDAEIHHRMELMCFTQKDTELLMDCQIFIQEQIEDIARIFYEKQTSFEEIDLIIGDAGTLDRLIIAQKKYIFGLFSGKYDLEYVNNRLRIGLVHKRIGVEPKYYLSAVKSLKDILVEIISRMIADVAVRVATCNALDKLLCFDTVLIVDIYIRSLVMEMESAKIKLERYALTLEEIVAERTQELNELSSKDGLTGLYNYRAFLECLRKELSYAKRNVHALSLVYFDVDDFKKVNDAYGHLRGDEILKEIGHILLNITRDIDIPSRHGGDEFCVVLSGSTSEDAKKFCERLISSFSKAFEFITLSIGISQTGPEIFDDREALIKRADSAMYEAKKSKGFQVVIDTDMDAPPL